jgi:protein-L-isoaspartate O-methyltransferase
MMMRAWRGMDAAATAAGAEPLPPGLWEQKADDGTIVVICRDNEHAQVEILRAKHDGRVVATWTLEEVVRVVLAQNSSVINQIKTTWPGATVERDRPKPRLVADDPVPDIAPDLENTGIWQDTL